MNNLKGLQRLAVYFELKGVYTLEPKGNNFKPIMSFSSRKKEIVNLIKNELDKYNIVYSLTSRENKTFSCKFYTLRICYIKNLEVFYKLFDENIIIKSKEYLEVKNYVLKRLKNKK